MKLVIASDAWFPQVNGVVRTLAATLAEIRRRGCDVELVTPEDFLTVPMPGYASIRLAVAPRFGLRRMLERWSPDVVHIATEGPIGWSARGWCLRHQVPFTTSFHTRFPDYASVRTGISADRFWPIMKRFHAPSRAVLAATNSLARELACRGFINIRHWGRGIDRTIFHPHGPTHAQLQHLPRPILLNVGRIALEKNLAAFLDAKVAGTKVLVGDGPDLCGLRKRYPDAVFLGRKSGEELASAYRSADCFVFPSRTDTFGLVIIEALACGVPVAAYPVPGPIDIIGADGRGVDSRIEQAAGVVDTNLESAIAAALRLDRRGAARLGQSYCWEKATDLFLAALTDAVKEPVATPPLRQAG
ncbi:MAG: glycosyltransferase family 1 protein [Novosphingobium sp.]|nr:glycosyltransferase family 1 protein [Novosphingobium sp.]